MELEWKIFPGFTTVAILYEIQWRMGKLQCDRRTSHAASSFMLMLNDIVWDAKGNDELCVNDSRTIKEYAERFPRGHWSFLDLKRSGTELTIAIQVDLGIELQRKCCWIAQKPIIRYSLVPVPWREENSEAKKVGRSQYTTMAAPKTLSCFSKLSSPSITSVSTEQ